MANFGKLLPSPRKIRRGIPFYSDKSESEVSADIYERYEELVIRQSALHLADELHGYYPFRKLLDYCKAWLPDEKELNIADLGCSVGRLIASTAIDHPDWDCYGIDYSYQMVKQADRFWKQSETLQLNLMRYGYGTVEVRGTSLFNLRFAMGRAEQLPFPSASMDVIINTFLLDRLHDPLAAFGEWQRVLKPGGRIITVSPFNFLESNQWDKYYPPMKVLDQLLHEGWQLLDLTDPLSLREPLDSRGNYVGWETVGFVLQK